MYGISYLSSSKKNSEYPCAELDGLGLSRHRLEHDHGIVLR